MPLGTVCVSTVSSRPRTWASYTNIRAKDVQGLPSMNSTEEIAKYREPASQYYSPTFNRRVLGCSYDFPDKTPKKDKKWSIGSLFRRKKKGGSESSSEEDKKGFLSRRKKKPEKRRKSVKPIGTFDHVVVPPGQRTSYHANGHEDAGILSDPTGGFTHYAGRALPKVPLQTVEQPASLQLHKISKESVEDVNYSRISVGSADGCGRKSRKDLAKARAEARRTSLQHESSSDEDSQRSASSSRFRSDDSLSKICNKRTRSARTERYLKRHSRDGENPKDYLRLSKSDAESSIMNWKLSDDSRSPSRSPLVPPNGLNRIINYSNSVSSQSNMSGLSTIPPPSHGNFLNKFRVSNSTSNPSYKPPLSMNEYNNSSRRGFTDNINNQHSISCDSNIHKAPYAEMIPEVMHVQIPISKPNTRYRNLSLVDASQLSRQLRQQPPPPPPRDPKRLITAHHVENGRPNSYFFDNPNQLRSQSFSNNNNNYNNMPNHNENRRFNSFILSPNFRSTSEDCLPKECSVQLVQRPSSTTPESSAPHRLINKTLEVGNRPENYQYLMEKKPRSRKPIFIQQNKENKNASANANIIEANSTTKKVLDFWKQKDKEGLKQNEVRTATANSKKSGSQSPQMFTCQTHVETKLFLPSVLQNVANNQVNSTETNKSYPIIQKNDSDAMNNNNNNNEKAPLYNGESSSFEADDKLSPKRKSSNLEDALNELEAIYNSLKLGDEDLLERAEQREKDAAAKKALEANIDPYIGWGVSRGALSDSSFSYEPFDSLDSPRRKRLSKRNTIDRKLDDMAYRKLNKERASTIGDPQSVLAKVSYLLASPVYNSDEDIQEDGQKQNDEPDITFDDVVYRNVKHANNTLKVLEPQPPFGIPLGPITPGANSDYLHAVPEDTFTPTYKRKKIPDIVKDDLAFRNLRKDQNKEPALPPLSPEDFTNNNNNVLEHPKLDLAGLKKRRAVRSLSANIGSLVHDPAMIVVARNESQNNNDENEFNNLTDIADAMEIARQVLKEKENRINVTRRAFLSDTDSGNCRNINYPETMTENRLNFLNEFKKQVPRNDEYSTRKTSRLGDDFANGKPPRGMSPDRRRSPHKESTPIPFSPMEDRGVFNNNNSQKSSFEDLLTAMAVEAKETTERITRELKQLAEVKEKKQRNKEVEKSLQKEAKEAEIISENRRHVVNRASPVCVLENRMHVAERASPVGRLEDRVEDNSRSRRRDEIEEKLSEIDAVSEHAKLCEKLLGCVVDSTELMTSSRPPSELVENIEADPVLAESVASVILTRDEPKTSTTPRKSENLSESEHDYENLTSDKELNVDEIPIIETTAEPHPKCRSPFEEHKAELIASFRELGKEDQEVNRCKLRSGANIGSHEEAKNEIKKHADSVYDNVENIYENTKADEGAAGERECVDVVEISPLETRECAFRTYPCNKSNTNRVQKFISNCDITLSRPQTQKFENFVEPELDDFLEDFETSSGFVSNCSSNNTDHFNRNTIDEFHANNLDSLESLKSPKLVLATTKLAKTNQNSNEDEMNLKDKFLGDDAKHSRNVLNNTPRPDIDSNIRSVSRENFSALHDAKRIPDSDPKRAWYCDPANVALACSYGIACAHQLASLDLLTILGILFAVLSFMAALLN